MLSSVLILSMMYMPPRFWITTHIRRTAICLSIRVQEGGTA